MAKIKIKLNDCNSNIQVHSDTKGEELPKLFSMVICGFAPNAGEEDEPEIVAVLIDRYEMQELIVKLQMLMRNQVK